MRERKFLRLRWIAAVLIAATASSSAAFQEVNDLTSSNPTPEQLIEILKPMVEQNLGGARGIGVSQRPKCSLKQAGGSRGIGLKPISDVAALRVHFAYNSAEILPEARQVLDNLGKALSSHDLSASCFQIMGHTDSMGSDSYNDRLSQARAEAVVRYLTRHFGIEPDRLDTVGFGESKPLAENATEEGRSKNRRVEIVTVGS